MLDQKIYLYFQIVGVRAYFKDVLLHNVSSYKMADYIFISYR